MQKIVINKRYGGFALSPEALLWLFEKGYDGKNFKEPAKDCWGEDGSEDYDRALTEWRQYIKSPNLRESLSAINVFSPDEKYILYIYDIDRHNELLVSCVEELGERANGSYAKLEVIEIPDGVEYTIEAHAGIEWVAEKHRTWG